MRKPTLTLVLVGLALLALYFSATRLLTGGAGSSAGSHRAALTVANQLYRSGQLAEAVQAYEQLVNQGVQDSVLFYNLGNAYLEQGDLGRSILNYQRAARLDPRDADIRANLEIARARVVEPISDAPAPSGPLTSLANLSRRWLTLDESALLALGFWFLAGWLILVWRQLAPGAIRSGVGATAIAALVLVMVFGALLGSRLYVERTQPDGVIVAPEIALSGQPAPGAAVEWTLHDGAEVRVVETVGAWARLALPGNVLEGWAPLNGVEIVAV